jgi:site-specific DNA-cytosine methylase
MINIIIQRLYKQLGNSVVVPVIKRIAEQIEKVVD